MLEVEPSLEPKQDHTRSGLYGRRQNSITEIATPLDRPGRLRGVPSHWLRLYSLSGSAASALNAAHIGSLTTSELAKTISGREREIERERGGGEGVNFPGDSSDVRLVVLTRRAEELRIKRFRNGERRDRDGSRYLDMEMGCPGANAKLESINFTPQVTAIGGDGGTRRLR